MLKRLLRLACYALCLCLLGPSGAQAEIKTRKIELAGLSVAFWQPDPSDGSQPLLLFSHGFDSCNTQSTFLMRALAEHGYWVFAPNHGDVGCGIGHKGANGPVVPFRQPGKWRDTTYAERGDDIRLLFDALQHDATFKKQIDFSRVGLIGHSLGGYATLGLAGAWPNWPQIPTVKAVLTFAPYIHPYLAHHTLGNIKVPVMYQVGSLDPDITKAVWQDGGYNQTPKQKYFVELNGAHHLSWTDPGLSHAAQIITYSELFLDHYVKGLPASPALTSVATGVSKLAYDSDIGEKKE